MEAAPSAHRSSTPESVLNKVEVERLRAAGFVIVPLVPTPEMERVGAPNCYSAYDGSWEVACRDAGECYRAMVEFGCL